MSLEEKPKPGGMMLCNAFRRYCRTTLRCRTCGYRICWNGFRMNGHGTHCMASLRSDMVHFQSMKCAGLMDGYMNKESSGRNSTTNDSQQPLCEICGVSTYHTQCPVRNCYVRFCLACMGTHIDLHDPSELGPDIVDHTWILEA